VATPSFEDQSADLPLTQVLDEPFDPHPNDAGHRTIADAIMASLEDVR
jgi:lysophospholipase L1-like esterase